MRLVACAAGVLGGASWLAGALTDGDPAKLLGWIGLGLLSVTWLVFGFLTASGSLVWLRMIVAVAVFALVWSLVGIAISEAPDKPVRGTVGGLALVFSIVAFVRMGASSRAHGTHSR